MSGGSMNYLHFKVKEAEFTENTPERKAFREHLNLVAQALYEIEWADSGDTCKGEYDTPAIMACISKANVIDTLLKEAKEIRDQLNKYLKE